MSVSAAGTGASAGAGAGGTGAGNSSAFFSALSNLQNSTSGLNTNYQAPSLTGFQNPGYQNLGQNVPWNMTGSDFGSTTAGSGQGSGSGSGFWSNVGNMFSGLYDHLKGGMEGAVAGYAGYTPPSWEQTQNPNQDTFGQAIQREFDMSGLGGIANAAKGGWNGLVNDPQQAQQDYQQNVTAPFNSMPAVPRFMNQFLTNTATDPLTYVPVGTIAKATGIAPALKFGFDWARGAVKGGDTAGGLADTVGNIAKSAAGPTDAATKSIAPDLLQLPAPNIKGVLPELTQTTQDSLAQALQKSIKDGQAADINSWAGLDGGYKPAVAPVEIPTQKLVGQGAKLFTKNPNVDLQKLFSSAGELPAGRELESLQDKWSSIAPKDGGSFENLLKSVDNYKPLNEILSNVQARNAAMRSYGIDPSEFMPKTVRPFGSQLAPTTETVLKEVESNPNFVMKFPLALRDEMGMVPAGGVRTNPIYDALGLTREDAARIAANQSVPDMLNQAIKESAPAAVDAGAQAAKAPYAAYNWQSKLGAPLAQKMMEMAPNGVPGIRALFNNPMTDALGKLFVRFHGATPEVANALHDMENAKNADLQNITTTMRGMAQKHGLSNDEMTQAAHVLEGIHPGGASDKVMAAANDLRDLMENGLNTPEGRVLGTAHELGTVDHAGRPTLDATKLRENYYPHVYNESKAAPPVGGNSKVFSARGASNKERTFDTVLDAQKAGYKPEMNPYIAVGQRLAESSQKIRNAQLLSKLQEAGILSKDEADGLVAAGAIPQLNGYHVPENDLSALKSFLAPRQPGFFLNAYDKGLSGWKKVSLLNSLVHGHNVAYNGMLLGGAKPAYVKEAFGAIKNSGGDQWFQRALRAGAISADRGKFLDNLKSAVKGVSNPIRDKISYALHGALWDFDKAMRTAIFREAVEGGATDTEAAARANKFLVNYNNMTPFESQVVSRVFPFYRWTKGNMPLQVEQWINNTPKQMLYEHAKQVVQQSLTGQNMRDDGKIDTGITLPDGSHVLIDPYSPSDEPLKALQEGIAPYMYGKLNPIVKLASQLGSNQKYYPSAFFAPNGKESMASQPIYKAGQDDNAQSVIAQILSNALPSTGAAGSAASMLTGDPLATRGLVTSSLGLPTKDKPASTVTELLTQLLGGFSSRDNPTMDNYYQQKDAQDALKNRISEMYQQGIPIPKSLTKQEYAKIPYPGGTGN